jgi:DNA-binding NarL/FixJ family response regulator
MEKQVIQVALVEDQHLIRQSLAGLIGAMEDVCLVLEAANGNRFIELLEEDAALPDIAIVDMNMPGLSGMDVNAILRQQYPSVKVIVLSVHAQERFIAKMIQEGACAYLTKNCDAVELHTAIKAVHQVGFYINNATLIALQNVAAYRNKKVKGIDAVPVELTRREKEILLLICKEYNNVEIAGQLFLSIRTVEGHRNNLLMKTDCRNTAGLVLFAVRYGIFVVI